MSYLDKKEPNALDEYIDIIDGVDTQNRKKDADKNMTLPI
jgi:hypothetical protein